MKKLSNTEAELKKSVAYKKSVYIIYQRSKINNFHINPKHPMCLTFKVASYFEI